MVSRIKPCTYFLEKYPILGNDDFCEKFPHIVLATAIMYSLNEFHEKVSELYKETSELEIPNRDRIGHCPEIFPGFEKIGIGKSIGKYLSLLESCSHKTKKEYSPQERKAMRLYNQIADEINEEENSEREITKHLIKNYFSITPKEYFNLIIDIKSKQEENIKLNPLEKSLIKFNDNESLRPYLLDLSASFEKKKYACLEDKFKDVTGIGR